MKRSFLSCAGGLLAGVALGVAPLAAALGDPISRQLDNQRPFALSATDSSMALDREVDIFIRLDEPAVSELVRQSMDRGRGMPDGGAQRAQAARVDAQQAAFRSRLASLGVTEIASLRVGANGLHVRMPASNVAAVRSMAGVRSVAPVAEHTIENAQSVPWIGTQDFWDAIGTGEGVSVGVIDTGIDYLHANFGGSGDPADYAANDSNTSADGGFPNAKVVGGHDFVGDAYSGSATPPIPDDDPLDCNGHGSHVGGSATGLGVPATGIGPGVAPGADLYALKVFGCTGGTTVTSQAIEWAMDPNDDGDMSDHLDVINMSLGSPYGFVDDPSAISSDNAAAVGVIVVTSAGNSGDNPYVTGSPGTAAAAISTAASTKGGDVLGVNITGDTTDTVEAIEGSSPATIAANPVSAALVQPSDPTNIFGCNPIADDMTGQISLISRGACSFALKSTNSENAGAIGMLVYNDGTDPSRVAPIAMGGQTAATIPSAMTDANSGAALSTTLTGGGSLNAEMDAGIVTMTAFGDIIAGFSSRGPGGDSNSFKPDITAPGVAIVSTGVGSGTGPATLQGTSMASPHVAGVAALLRQQHPTLDQAGVKALIQNSAEDMNPLNGVLPITRQGAGRADISNAMDLSSYASPGGVAFGRINPTRVKQVTKKVDVVDLSGSGRRVFNVTHVPNQAPTGVTVTCKNKVTVKNGVGNMWIRMRVESADVPTDFASFDHQEADGWCVLDDGVDTLKVAYTGAVDGASKMFPRGFGGQFINIRNTGDAIGWAEGFTRTGVDGTVLDGEPHAIDEVGFRTNTIIGFPVVEMGVATDSPWGAINNLDFSFFIDVDFDGSADVLLQAVDQSVFFGPGAIGTMVTAQFDLVNGGGFLDWTVGGSDYNDRTAFFPFTTVAGGLFVPDAFDYTLVVTGRDGSQDIQMGSVDLANEVILDLPSLGLLGGDETTFEYASPTRSNVLWLMQNNTSNKQVKSHRVQENVVE